MCVVQGNDQRRCFHGFCFSGTWSISQYTGGEVQRQEGAGSITGIYIISNLDVVENLMEDLRRTALLDRQNMWESFSVKGGVATLSIPKVFDLCCYGS